MRYLKKFELGDQSRIYESGEEMESTFGLSPDDVREIFSDFMDEEFSVTVEFGRGYKQSSDKEKSDRHFKYRDDNKSHPIYMVLVSFIRIILKNNLLRDGQYTIHAMKSDTFVDNLNSVKSRLDLMGLEIDDNMTQVVGNKIEFFIYTK